MHASRWTRALALAAGSLAWSAYDGRLVLRALHMLQLEGYQTGRFLAWSARKAERWARADRAVLTVGAALVGGLANLPLRSPSGLTPPGPPSLKGRGEQDSPFPSREVGGVGLLAWAAIGAWLWRGARPEPAKKPLVLTARAKRLLAGEALVGLAVAGGPAALLALTGRTWGVRTRGLAAPALMVGLSGASLVAPLVAAGANLLLWPVEEAYRRYYLRDARRILRAYGPTAIGVAGSYGKTSTKEFLATILAARWRVLKPPGSYNTPMGLSRAIREGLRPEHELFVAELGDYVPGDIRFLCDLVGPRIGVLTTIGPEHLERFKTIERIVQSKAELIDALPADGVAVINQDDPLVQALGDRAAARGLRVVRYGVMGDECRVSGERRVHTEHPSPITHHPSPSGVRACDVRATREGLIFRVIADGRGEATFRVGVLGRHNVANVLAATAVGLELGMTLDEIADAARAIAPVEHRLQPIQGEGGVLVIDDAFNSNPRGAAVALDVLAELDGGRRVLVTPGMIELAERELDENRAFGRKAAAVCDEVILVGPERAIPILTGLRDGDFPAERTHVVRNLAEATARLGSLIGPGDVVLFENDLPDTYDDGVGRRAGRARRSGPPLSEGVGASAAPTPAGAPADRPSFVSVDGVRVAYREHGKHAGRLPVIVLHGWGASSVAVGSIQRCLETEHRTIAPDLPGFGESDPPPRDWGNADYARLIRAFLAELGIARARFIGHSRGGAVSIVLAATAPELVERLVLVDSAGIRPRRGPTYRARVLAFKAARLASRGLPVQDWLMGRFGSDDYRQAGAMRGTLVRVVNEDLRSLLPRIQAPTLLIWGERDDFTPLADGRLIERLIPDAGLVVFPGAGHFAYADDPGRFCRVVSHFLRA